MHWLDKIVELFESDSNDLNELAAICGYPTERLYDGTLPQFMITSLNQLQDLRSTRLFTDEVDTLARADLRLAFLVHLVVTQNVDPLDGRQNITRNTITEHQAIHDMLAKLDSLPKEDDRRLIEVCMAVMGQLRFKQTSMFLVAMGFLFSFDRCVNNYLVERALNTTSRDLRTVREDLLALARSGGIFGQLDDATFNQLSNISKDVGYKLQQAILLRSA